MNPLVDDITKSSCKLSWEPPEFDGGAPITGYLVEKRTGYSSRFSKVNKQPIDSLELQISDLSEGETYEYQIMAVNEAGTGKPSVTTGQFVAKDPFTVPEKPGVPEVEEITEESASLAWTEPKADGGSPITNYLVEMRKVGEVKWIKTSKEEVKDRKYKVTGLERGTEYEFRVTAENKAGTGAPSGPSKPVKYGKSNKNLVNM